MAQGPAASEMEVGSGEEENDGQNPREQRGIDEAMHGSLQANAP
jgi:hypothetical protein